MRLVLLILAATLSCAAQFRSIEITFTGVGCVSCIESLPARMQRIRGVESATVDAAHGIVKIQLAGQNRVKLEQVRDAIEQDGTKTKSAAVRVQGAVSQVDGKWVLQPAGVSSSYAVTGTPPAPGTYIVMGDVGQLRPESGPLVIQAREWNKAD